MQTLDSRSASIVSQFSSMIANSLIAARVTSDIKDRFAALAWRQGLTESALLKRLVDSALDAAGEAYDDEMEPVRPVAIGTRISVRLYAEDLLLLRERATARSIPTGTYISMLVRSHLRSLTPLPSDELAEAKHCRSGRHWPEPEPDRPRTQSRRAPARAKQ